MAVDEALVAERFWRPVANFEVEPTKAASGSPEWWAYWLNRELDGRMPLVQVYEDYYEGRHKLGLATRDYRKVFGRALAPVSDPWMALVVGASVERLQVQGFRLGQGDELDADKDAWDIWQRNGLDEDAALLFTETCKIGEAYLLVWKDDGDTVPLITVEHPGQMAVARAAGNRRQVAAAFKRWQDLDGTWLATLYLPDRTVRLRWNEDRKRWVPRDLNGISAESPNPLGIVPVVPVVNDPHMLPCYPPTALLSPPHSIQAQAAVGLGRSDLADVISTQDQINKVLCDMLIASEFGAHRQRYMIGVENPVDEDGNPKPIEMGAARVINVPESDGVQIGEFGATDLKNYIGAIEQRIQSLASRTRVPVHYLLGGQGSFPSGESLRAAETGLIAKVKGKQKSYGGAFEQAIRLAFGWLGDPRQDAQSAEVDWRDPEYRTESEFWDAQVKKLAVGIPMQQIWEDGGYSPQEIERMREMIRKAGEDQALIDATAAIVNPPTPPASAPTAAPAPSVP